ncbi:MAG: pyruvate formate lyase activating enzyme, partial [Thermoanaerobacterium sp.]|nr:pyruvate formate lyase activating enzyme [Thermoanaerobacterium sp.]
MKEAMFYEKMDNDSVHCLLCPQNCIINDGKYGFCRARKNEGGVLYSENYGKIASIAMDPIEKKPLYHFMPGSYILSVGTYGCNLRCLFCQNWEISQQRLEGEYLSP